MDIGRLVGKKVTGGWGLHVKCQGTLTLDAYANSDFAGSLTVRQGTLNIAPF